MFGVEDVLESAQDDRVDGVSAGSGIVFFPESGHEVREYGIVVSGSERRESEIRDTQVGDPLTDGREDLRYRASSDGFAAFTRSTSVSESEDEEVGYLVFGILDAPQGRVMAELSAEGSPLCEVRALGSPCFRDIGFCGG